MARGKQRAKAAKRRRHAEEMTQEQQREQQLALRTRSANASHEARELAARLEVAYHRMDEMEAASSDDIDRERAELQKLRERNARERASLDEAERHLVRHCKVIEDDLEIAQSLDYAGHRMFPADALFTNEVIEAVVVLRRRRAKVRPTKPMHVSIVGHIDRRGRGIRRLWASQGDEG